MKFSISGACLPKQKIIDLSSKCEKVEEGAEQIQCSKAAARFLKGIGWRISFFKDDAFIVINRFEDSKYLQK